MTEYGAKLSIRYASPNQYVSGLSGGNQQKVILARALAEECKVLLLAEPTRGVDVGAKQEIYTLIDMLLEQGIAVMLQSSELPELIRLAERCLVFSGGKMAGELAGKDFTQQSVVDAINQITDWNAGGAIRPVDWTTAHGAAQPGEKACASFVQAKNGKCVDGWWK